jgi:hypothetical protein
VLDRLGPDPERTPDGMVIVPDECVRDLIERRRRYVLEDSSLSLHLDLSLDGQDRHAVS